MAARNLMRRKRRTLITALSIALGIFLSVTFTAMGDYSYTNMINTSAKMGFGHVTIEPAGYNASPTLSKRIGAAGEIRDLLLAQPGVEKAIVRISGQAMFASASKSAGGVFIGIDPAMETPDANVFLSSVTEGAVFDGTSGRGALVGSRLAEKLNLKIGKKFIYTTTSAEGDIVSEMARVSGVFKTGVDEVDGATVLLPIDSARQTLGYAPDEATIVSVFINDYRDANIARDAAAAVLAGRRVESMTWSQTQAELAGHVEVDRAFNYFYQFLVGIMIAAGILNTMMMGVLERQREFGVMLAIGMRPSRLFMMVLVESIWLGLIGLALGVIVTAPWYVYMHQVGLDLSRYWQEGTDVSGVLIDPVLKFRLYRESVMWILAGVFSLAVAAGLYPAWKAGRVVPVESLKTI